MIPTREELKAIRARGRLQLPLQSSFDRRALLALLDEVAAAAGKVDCHNCRALGFPLVRGPGCPDCADLRRLLEVIR